MKTRILLTLSVLSLLTVASMAAAMPKTGSQAAATAPQGEALSGKVLQTMNSGGYSYIYLQQKDGKKVWVAVTETPVKVGDKMSFQPGTVMPNFESKSLNRKFDSIVFSGGVISSAGTTKATPPTGSATQGSKGAATAKETKLTVEKASGANAYTVEGAFDNRAKLDKKKVVIRGKVVKVSGGIMGKNWVHIQDGTGSQAKGNHNMVCTTSQDAAIGDVVTVTGTLAKDRDFGAGYKYTAIIEDAKLKK